jgi:hypothetical protein
MSVPESQLQTWSNQGAITTAQSTHTSIRNALSAYNWPVDVSYNIYFKARIETQQTLGEIATRM